MLKIGFANVYYTLWDVTSDTIYSTNANGNHFPSGTSTRYTYYQNLSKDEQKAKEKAKLKGVIELEVDPDLRGKNRSWTKTTMLPVEPKEVDPLVYQFGKYSNEPVNESNDLDYLKWYYYQLPEYPISHVDYPKHNGVVKDRILELSNEHCEYNDELMLITQRDDIMVGVVNKEFVKEHGYYIGTFERNVDDHGRINVDGIDFMFPEVVTRYYQDWEYYLPVKGGKGKRVKGKRIKIYSDGIKDEHNIVSDFEIIK